MEDGLRDNARRTKPLATIGSGDKWKRWLEIPEVRPRGRMTQAIWRRYVAGSFALVGGDSYLPTCSGTPSSTRHGSLIPAPLGPPTGETLAPPPRTAQFKRRHATIHLFIASIF